MPIRSPRRSKNAYVLLSGEYTHRHPAAARGESWRDRRSRRRHRSGRRCRRYRCWQRDSRSPPRAGAIDNANSWFRPPLPFPDTVTVVSPEAITHSGRSVDARAAIAPTCAQAAASRASPVIGSSTTRRDSRATRRSARAIDCAALRTDDPRVCARAVGSPAFGVSGNLQPSRPAQPVHPGLGIFDVTATARRGRRAPAHRCCRRGRSAPTRSPTGSSPTTSEIASVSTVRRCRRELPALDRRQVLAHGVELVDVGACSISVRAVCCLSSSVMSRRG